MVNRTLPTLDAVTAAEEFVFRNATVVSVDPATGTLDDADVLVVGDSIAGVGPALEVPQGTVEIDARGGIVMPGMIDTHRHMWQSVMRGYGADWTLTNYFYFYYLDWGQVFRPEEVYAGNLLAGLDSIDAGVTTTLDWSHGLRTTDHAEAAVDALERVDGRFVFAYGNLAEGPWEWTTRPEFKDFVSRRLDGRGDMLRWQIAFDVPGDPEFPEGPAFAVARELDARITTHSGVWGATSDASIQMMAEHGYLTDKLTHVHVSSLSEDSYQRIAASGGARVGGDGERMQRRAGLLPHRAAAQVRHPDFIVGRHQLMVVRRHVRRDAGGAEPRPCPRTSRGAPRGRDGDEPVAARGRGRAVRDARRRGSGRPG